MKLDAAWFDNRYRNIIATKTISFSPFRSQYFNIGLTSARGAELSADVALVSGFRAKTGYTFTDSEILESTSTSPVFKAGNWAFRRPRHSGFLNLAWTGARASIDLRGAFSGRRVDSDFSSLVPAILENGGYAQWDIRAIARLTRVFSLTGAIDNLTDSDHMEVLGYPVLGRAIRFGVRARFSRPGKGALVHTTRSPVLRAAARITHVVFGISCIRSTAVAVRRRVALSAGAFAFVASREACW